MPGVFLNTSTVSMRVRCGDCGELLVQDASLARDLCGGDADAWEPGANPRSRLVFKVGLKGSLRDCPLLHIPKPPIKPTKRGGVGEG